MGEKHFRHDDLESLGRKLDGFAKELTDDERYLLSAVIEAAGQRATGDPDLSLSDRLHRVRGRLDAGAFHAMI
jgi:hypothetical protein